MERYRILDEIGEGLRSSVFLAEDTRDGRRVALKQVYGHRDDADDGAELEASMMRRLQHENILRLLDVFPDNGSTVLVTEYFRRDLRELLDDSAPQSTASIRDCLKCILAAVKHCHASGVVHRDIKPENVLLDGHGRCVLADFGSAVVLKDYKSREYFPGTRWYRAPEYMLGQTSEQFSGDMWAVGCVLAQMLNLGRPLFAGVGDIDHLCQIFHVLGGPTRENWPSYMSLPEAGKLTFDDDGVGLASVLGACAEDALDLVKSLLRLEPSERLGAAEALQHAFFTRQTPPEPSQPSRT